MIESPIEKSPSHWRASIVYLAMIALAVVAFFVIREFGEQLTPSAQTAPVVAKAPSSASTESVLIHVLLAMGAVIVVGRILSAAFRYLGQPPVIGEIVAGILIGPSALGGIWPEATAFLLPANVAPVLGIVAQVGVVLYMFCVGLEMDPELLKERGSTTVAISHASIVTPFLLGTLLSLWLYSQYAVAGVSFTTYSLFLGVAMSITAFPVLARILSDQKLTKTPLGIVAITCAAADDATAWCLLAFVVGVAQGNWSSAMVVIGLAMLYVALMIWLARPTLHYWGQRAGDNPSLITMAVLLLFVSLSAWTTKAIGIHAIFGGFLLGAIMPHDSGLARTTRSRIESPVKAILLPAFFAFSGMRTQIGLIYGWEDWFWCLVIIAVATLGKWGGTAIAARLTGLSWKDATRLGILMNTRGLMELIVLNIGLDLGLISPTIFAMMVLMALATTLATTPLLYLLECRHKPEPFAQ
jgi:Kef-type K+ transport system membrane component KefB